MADLRIQWNTISLDPMSRFNKNATLERPPWTPQSDVVLLLLRRRPHCCLAHQKRAVSSSSSSSSSLSLSSYELRRRRRRQQHVRMRKQSSLWGVRSEAEAAATRGGLDDIHCHAMKRDDTLGGGGSCKKIQGVVTFALLYGKVLNSICLLLNIYQYLVQVERE